MTSFMDKDFYLKEVTKLFEDVSRKERMGLDGKAYFTSGAVTCDGCPLLHLDTNKGAFHTMIFNIIIPDDPSQELTPDQLEGFSGVCICPQTGVEVHLPHGGFLLHQGSDADVGFHVGAKRHGDEIPGPPFRRYMLALYLKKFT
ncbi:hypothetical protein CYMTET_48842 [Cymbomonas tetramitiformis]|uniref:Uncharacterized protein n=1 Tax=Cymbomonas tetramitiformis TaxID=36881 RepID=A0AAE0EV48_9CHLO|nr:hypothetical protein CYMTET_48842 [Cymbomonas tetramitiformis]